MYALHCQVILVRLFAVLVADWVQGTPLITCTWGLGFPTSCAVPNASFVVTPEERGFWLFLWGGVILAEYL